MEKKTKNKKIGLEEAKELFKAFNYSFYWLEVLVKQGCISEAVAGRVIFNWRINQ